jgi:NodT family efflux transporter outer membrane factor (OMF) lipoprotein
MVKGIIVCFMAGVFLTACTRKVVPDHKAATESIAPEKVTQRQAFAGAEAADTGEVDDGWIENFHDDRLTRLVDEAMQNNPRIQASAARVERAQALVQQSEASLKPTVGVGGALAGVTGGKDVPSGGGLGIAWEADVWGRLRIGVAASKEEMRATQADYAFARMSLAAATAKAWFLAVEAKLQLNFIENVVGLTQEILKLVTTKHEVGKVSMQDVHMARSQLAEIQNARAKAKAAYDEALRSLELLLGRYPAGAIQTADVLAPVPPPIPVGQPSTLLERRPDLIAAEDRVAEAFYAEKGAELLRLPRFVIGGGAGLTNLSNAIAGLAGGVFAPLYTGGRIEGQIRQATAEQKGAIADYANKALQAFKEVETALDREKYLKDQAVYLETAAKENQQAYDLAKVQYDVGKVDFLNVLELQNRWIGSQMSLLNVRQQQLAERVDLHLALGGSFEKRDSPAGSNGSSQNS